MEDVVKLALLGEDTDEETVVKCIDVVRKTVQDYITQGAPKAMCDEMMVHLDFWNKAFAAVQKAKTRAELKTVARELFCSDTVSDDILATKFEWVNAIMKATIHLIWRKLREFGSTDPANAVLQTIHSRTAYSRLLMKQLADEIAADKEREEQEKQG